MSSEQDTHVLAHVEGKSTGVTSTSDSVPNTSKTVTVVAETWDNAHLNRVRDTQEQIGGGKVAGTHAESIIKGSYHWVMKSTNRYLLKNLAPSIHPPTTEKHRPPHELIPR